MKQLTDDKAKHPEEDQSEVVECDNSLEAEGVMLNQLFRSGVLNQAYIAGILKRAFKDGVLNQVLIPDCYSDVLC